MKSKTKPTSKSTSEKIERVKLDLLSLVSHELRTPLTSVLNAIRILREEKLSAAESRGFLDMAYRNAETLNAKLSQLLDLSKLVSGRLVCRFHEVSLRNLFFAQLERLSEDANAKGVSLQIDASARQLNELPVLLGDAPRLEQVVWGLFENTLKFTPQGGRVAVKVRGAVKTGSLPKGMASWVAKGAKDKTEFVVLEVSNSIASHARVDLERMFTVFGQNQGILEREQEGLGGTLAIAAEVLRQHGGALHAEAANAKFTVWLVLPVLENEAALIKVVESRIFAVKTHVGSLSLVVLKVDARGLKQVQDAIREALFRASDSVYGLTDSNQIVVLMDDCKKPDAPKIVRRLLRGAESEAGKYLATAKVGLATCPDDDTDAHVLLKLARAGFVPLGNF